MDQGSFNMVLTLSPSTLVQLKRDLIAAKLLSFSLLEWRGDYLQIDGQELFSEVLKGLKIIKEEFSDIPLIFTFRAREEGGQSVIADEELWGLRYQVVQSQLVELLDIEGFWLSKREDSRLMSSYRSLIKEAKEKHIKIILSYHDFLEFPGSTSLIHIFQEMVDHGADLVKGAVMTKVPEEIQELKILSSFLIESLNVPHVLIGMGEIGRSSRFDARHYNSCMTYGVLNQTVAPGQMTISELKVKLIENMNEKTY